MKKRFFFIAVLAFAAGVFASCEKDPEVSAEEVSIYLTTGLPVADQVYYIINYTELTEKYDTTGVNVINLKLRSSKAVKTAVSATVSENLSKVPASWKAMPESAYKLDVAVSEIAAGADQGTNDFVITIDPDAMPEAGMYALPVTIETSSQNVKVSETSNTVIIRFIRNVVNGGPEGWSRISSDRYTAGALDGYVGIDLSSSGQGVAAAFDNDLTTGWFSTTFYSYTDADGNTQYMYADDNSYNSGCFAEVVFKEAVTLKGLLVSADPDSDYYKWYRPRRLSILFKYEGDDDYTWSDKPYEADESAFSFCPMLEGTNDNMVESIPGYVPSAADHLIDDPDYSTFAIDLSSRLGGRKISSMIILPAPLYGGRQYLIDDNGNYVIDDNGNYVYNYDEEKQDFVYEYYYDIWYGAYVNEITLYE